VERLVKDETHIYGAGLPTGCAEESSGPCGVLVQLAAEALLILMKFLPQVDDGGVAEGQLEDLAVGDDRRGLPRGSPAI